jgi:predicted oxidoreductase
LENVKLCEKMELTRVVAGCMRANDAGVSGDAFLKFVHKCIDMGVNCFDHAPVYGGYTCEKLFGDGVLRKEPALRKKIRLITKAGIVLPGVCGNKHIYYDSRKESLLKEIDSSLQKLGTDYVDVLLIHRPDPLADPHETAEALETIVKSGKALSIGVSNYEPSQLSALQSCLSIPLVTNQLEFSVKSPDNFLNGSSDYAFQNGMSLMAWSPLGGGSVFKGQDEKSVRLRTILQEIAQAHGTTVDAVMYAWLFVHPVRLIVVTGTMNVSRIKTAVDAMNLSLSYDEWYAILAASRGYDVP